MMHGIPYDLLRTLVAVADAGSASKAASLLGITQPTVSRQLQQLEGRAPVPLFRAFGQQRVLTEYGRALVAALKPRFDALEAELGALDRRHARAEQVTLRVGARREILTARLAAADFPGTLELVPMGTSEIATALKAGRLDVAIAYDLPPLEQYLRKKLFEARFVVAVPEGWGKGAWVERCIDRPFAAYRYDAPYLTRGLAGTPFAAGIVPRFVADDWHVVEARVRASLAWALIPSEFAAKGRGYAVFELPEVQAAQPFFVVYRRDIARAPWLRTFLRGLAGAGAFGL